MAPSRSRAHLAFIRTLPCCVCGRTRGVEAAHTPRVLGVMGGGSTYVSRGMGQKRSDLETIPLCRLHHEEQHRSGWPHFILTYQLDLLPILAELREKPRLTIISPYVYAWYRGAEFELKPISMGLHASIECAVSVCGEYLRDQLLQRRAA